MPQSDFKLKSGKGVITMIKCLIIATLLLAFMIDFAFAHGGGCLAADKPKCCHVDRATGEKHCHEPKGE